MWWLWKWSKEWAAINCSKFGNSCESSWISGQRPSSNSKGDGNQLHTKQEIIPQILHEDLEKKKTCVKSVPQTDGWAHSAITVKWFLQNCSMVVICHPPHSSHLAQADFFLIPTAKIGLTLRIQEIRTSQTSRTQHQVKHSSPGYFQWQFCSNFREMEEVCCSQGRLPWRKYNNFLLISCVSVLEASIPECYRYTTSAVNTESLSN